MESSIRGYLTEGTRVSYSQLLERFGEPKQVASTYVSEMETEELLITMKLHRNVFRVILVTAIVMVAMWAGVVGVALVNELNNSDGYLTKTIMDNTTGEIVYQEVYE